VRVELFPVDGRKDGRTDARTHGQTDKHDEAKAAKTSTNCIIRLFVIFA